MAFRGTRTDPGSNSVFAGAATGGPAAAAQRVVARVSRRARLEGRARPSQAAGWQARFYPVAAATWVWWRSVVICRAAAIARPCPIVRVRFRGSVASVAGRVRKPSGGFGHLVAAAPPPGVAAAGSPNGPGAASVFARGTNRVPTSARSASGRHRRATGTPVEEVTLLPGPRSVRRSENLADLAPQDLVGRSADLPAAGRSFTLNRTGDT